MDLGRTNGAHNPKTVDHKNSETTLHKAPLPSNPNMNRFLGFVGAIMLLLAATEAAVAESK